MIYLLLFILAFLIGTFAYSWRMLKRQSRKEESIDPAKLKAWEEDD